MWNKIFDALINKLHVAIGTAYAVALLAYRWKTNQDLGPGFTNFTYVFYGFLLGHAGVYQKWPDSHEEGSDADHKE